MRLFLFLLPIVLAGTINFIPLNDHDVPRGIMYINRTQTFPTEEVGEYIFSTLMHIPLSEKLYVFATRFLPRIYQTHSLHMVKCINIQRYGYQMMRIMVRGNEKVSVCADIPIEKYFK